MNHFTRRLANYGFQLLALLFAKLIIRPFTRIDSATVRPKLIQHTRYLIAANHRGAFDAFVICSSIPFKTILRILPIGFMTHNAFYDSPLKPLLWLAGSYPAKNPKSNHKFFGVEGSIDLLEHGYSIFIFPEGTRVRNKARGEAHWGVIKIHRAAPQTPLILAHIKCHPGIRNWLRGHHWTVSCRLIKNHRFSDPETIMNDIFAL